MRQLGRTPRGEPLVFIIQRLLHVNKAIGEDVAFTDDVVSVNYGDYTPAASLRFKAYNVEIRKDKLEHYKMRIDDMQVV